MRAADTNVLVRLIVQDDAKQLAAARSFVEGGVWVSTLALAETIWVLSAVYGLPAARLADVVEMFLDHEHLTLQDAQAVGHALALFRARPSLRFSDCLVLQLAREYGHAPLGTFDLALSRAPGATRL